jgi:hypothetical protein
MRYIVMCVKQDSGIIRTRVELMRIKLLKFLAVCAFFVLLFAAFGYKRKNRSIFAILMTSALFLPVLLWGLAKVYFKSTDPLRIQTLEEHGDKIGKNSRKKNKIFPLEEMDIKLKTTNPRIKQIRAFFRLKSEVYMRKMNELGWNIRWEIKEETRPVYSKEYKLARKNGLKEEQVKLCQ